MVLAADAAQVLASSSSADDGGGGAFFVLILLLAGPLFYARVHFRYRNTDKRHRHESETRSEVLDVRCTDTFVEHREGLRSRRMKGETRRSGL